MQDIPRDLPEATPVIRQHDRRQHRDCNLTVPLLAVAARDMGILGNSAAFFGHGWTARRPGVSSNRGG
jgi:hypothetical protein